MPAIKERAASKTKKGATKRSAPSRASTAPYTPLDFESINRRANDLADLIEASRKELEDILIVYESYEVVQDETARTLDILRNLKENKQYFHLRTGAVTSYLPRNQPLYALTCFVLVPSLMASEVHFRIPQSMRHFFPKLLKLLSISKAFPNVIVSDTERSEFLRQRSALLVNPKTNATIPVTDVVIFTGTPVHANQLRLVFDRRTLFIANGAGHNPIVIGKDANIAEAVDATLTLQLYNQGQDCAAPNAILVHKSILPTFLRTLKQELSKVKVGDYHNRSCRVGPISEPEDLVRIESFLVEQRPWLDADVAGVIRTKEVIVEPTVICKPLKLGGNFVEMFAPIIFVQEYEHDDDLALYFEHADYARNAMYVSLYGTSKYVTGLVGRLIGGKMLHDRASILHNTHLHAPGVERGVQPYGGYGYGASSLSLNGEVICKPTLPQRDMYEWIIQPLQRKRDLESHRSDLKHFTKVVDNDTYKSLKLKPGKSTTPVSAPVESRPTYVDLPALPAKGQRYIKVHEKALFSLLISQNDDYIAKLDHADLQLIRALRALLLKKPTSVEEFNTALYALPKKAGATEDANRDRQLRFFQNVYQLLLGKSSGPRLAQFLIEVDNNLLCELLDV